MLCRNAHQRAVTTAWGVDWDEIYIARDVMQNFFDANRDCLNEIRVVAQGKDVRITSPSAFNLDRLFYLGSEKGEDDIGQYGEGFKVAATCLLRDHSVDIIAASGPDVLRLRIADEPVRETGIYPVEYDFYQSDEIVPGAMLLLRNCSPKLTRAFTEGLTHFFHENNPLLGAMLWESYRAEFRIYESCDADGHVFYRKLKRGRIQDLPLVLVIDKEYAAIEKKISKDRDRNAFGEEIMRLFFKHFARHAVKGFNAGARIIVERSKQHWMKGHPLLNEIADVVGYQSAPAAVGRAIFADAYFARSMSRLPAEQIQFEALEKKWRVRGGKNQFAPSISANLGVPQARPTYRGLAGKGTRRGETRQSACVDTN